MLGVGAGGLALSSSAAGLSWSKITPQSQGTSDIKSSTVADGAITSPKISPDAVGSSEVASSSISTSQLSFNFDQQAQSAVRHDTANWDYIPFPHYTSESDVPSLSPGQIVYIENQNQLYIEDGT
jgi:hypothetical protein